MIETVRLVSDGEELVSSQAETLHIHSEAAARAVPRVGRPVSTVDRDPFPGAADPTRRPAARTPPDGRP